MRQFLEKTIPARLSEASLDAEDQAWKALLQKITPHGIDPSGNRLRRIDAGSRGPTPSLCSQKGVTLLPRGLRAREGNDEGGESAEQGGIVEGDEKINVAD